jgi:hypothetical protein
MKNIPEHDFGSKNEQIMTLLSMQKNKHPVHLKIVLERENSQKFLNRIKKRKKKLFILENLSNTGRI